MDRLEKITKPIVKNGYIRSLDCIRTAFSEISFMHINFVACAMPLCYDQFPKLGMYQ